MSDTFRNARASVAARVCLEERIAGDPPLAHDVAVEERDMQTVLEALFDIKVDVRTILELLLEDDGQEEEEDDDA